MEACIGAFFAFLFKVKDDYFQYLLKTKNEYEEKIKKMSKDEVTKIYIVISFEHLIWLIQVGFVQIDKEKDRSMDAYKAICLAGLASLFWRTVAGF